MGIEETECVRDGIRRESVRERIRRERVYEGED